MHSTINRIAHFAHEWLSNQTRPNQTMWIWVGRHEDGLDLAQRMIDLRLGDFSSHEIPYDSLPTYAANADTGNRVFILCQPNHAESVLVTMQEDDAPMFTSPVHPEYAQRVLRLSQGQVMPVEVDFLQQTMSVDRFSVRTPDILLVDMEAPYWDILKMYIAPTTQVMLSDRVRVQPEFKTNAPSA